MSENFIIAIFTILGTALATYYTVLNPRKYKIDYEVVEKVYLPLVKFFHFRTQPISNVQDALKFYIYLERILENNYLYVPAELMKLYRKLLDEVSTNSEESINTVYEIDNFVSEEYENLKIRLNLPNIGWKNRFKRLSFISKIQFIFFKILNIFAFSLTVYFYCYLLIKLFKNSIYEIKYDVYIQGIIILLLDSLLIFIKIKKKE